MSVPKGAIRRCEIQGRNDTGENWRTDTEMIPKHNNLIGGQSTLSLILREISRALTGFPVTAIAAVLSRSPMTVKRSLNELETAGLIMRVRQGVGEPNRIYVLIPGKGDAALA